MIIYITSNRLVYASPPVGGSGYEKPQSGYALCAVFLRHIWGGEKRASHEGAGKRHGNAVE
jgi:hypothetical protein